MVKASQIQSHIIQSTNRVRGIAKRAKKGIVKGYNFMSGLVSQAIDYSKGKAKIIKKVRQKQNFTLLNREKKERQKQKLSLFSFQIMRYEHNKWKEIDYFNSSMKKALDLLEKVFKGKEITANEIRSTRDGLIIAIEFLNYKFSKNQFETSSLLNNKRKYKCTTKIVGWMNYISQKCQSEEKDKYPLIIFQCTLQRLATSFGLDKDKNPTKPFYSHYFKYQSDLTGTPLKDFYLPHSSGQNTNPRFECLNWDYVKFLMKNDKFKTDFYTFLDKYFIPLHNMNIKKDLKIILKQLTENCEKNGTEDYLNYYRQLLKGLSKEKVLRTPPTLFEIEKAIGYLTKMRESWDVNKAKEGE